MVLFQQKFQFQCAIKFWSRLFNKRIILETGHNIRSQENCFFHNDNNYCASINMSTWSRCRAVGAYHMVQAVAGFSATLPTDKLQVLEQCVTSLCTADPYHRTTPTNGHNRTASWMTKIYTLVLCCFRIKTTSEIRPH